MSTRDAAAAVDVSPPTGEVRLALVGTPNCGKTATFNRLTGARAKVANYSGVTVERRSGRARTIDVPRPVEIVDLPGTYSLTVTSPDEQVARQVITGTMPGERAPDCVVVVVDATRLQLGLRLALEVLELGVPMIVAVNVVDEAAKRGIRVDGERLSRELGDAPVVETVAVRSGGIAPLERAIERFVVDPHAAPSPRAHSDAELVGDAVQDDVQARLAAIIGACVTQPDDGSVGGNRGRAQERLDQVVLHPVLGPVLLAVVLLAMFQAVYAWAAPFMDLIDAGVGAVARGVSEVLPAGSLHDLVVNGLLAGVGGVLVFLPQILILFCFISLLEDSGYLPRAALLLDSPMQLAGLSGRSFIPLLSSFACAVPGIMATRTIPDPRERSAAILVAPLMTCSARLPVYTMLIGAFVPRRDVAWGVLNLQGLVLFGLYAAGVLSAAVVARVLHSTVHRLTRAERSLLLIELPSWRWPSLRDTAAFLRVRTMIFLRRVGKYIVTTSIVLWALATWPHAPAGADGAAIGYSAVGQIGRALHPLFAPLGFNWQMVVALIPAMAAREVAVSALATVYAVDAASRGDHSLGAVLHADWSLAGAVAFLVWFIYAPQCLATIATVRRETNSRRSTAVFVTYLFALAWIMAWLAHAIAARTLGGGA